MNREEMRKAANEIREWSRRVQWKPEPKVEYRLPATSYEELERHPRFPKFGQRLTDSSGLPMPFICKGIFCKPSPEPGVWIVMATCRRVENC